MIEQTAGSPEPVEFPAHWLSQFNNEFKPGEGTKMDADVKRRWLDALRSGDFPQGKKYLKTRGDWGNRNGGDKFCCLGVLCEQALAIGVLDSVVAPSEGEPEIAYRYRKDYSAEAIAEEKAWVEGHNGHWDEDTETMLYYTYNTMPGAEVQDWSGLPDRYMRALAGANDDGVSFALIADFIEKEF